MGRHKHVTFFCVLQNTIDYGNVSRLPRHKRKKNGSLENAVTQAGSQAVLFPHPLRPPPPQQQTASPLRPLILPLLGKTFK